jgi:hypothetical protein
MENITLLVLQNTSQRASIIESIEGGLVSLIEEEKVNITVREINLFSRAYAHAIDSRNNVELIIWHYLFESPLDDKIEEMEKIVEYGIPVLFVRERNEAYKKRNSNENICKRMKILSDFHVCHMKDCLENIEKILKDIISRRRELLM